ncbi:unnamed protein product [Ixodes pacificus]
MARSHKERCGSRTLATKSLSRRAARLRGRFRLGAFRETRKGRTCVYFFVCRPESRPEICRCVRSVSARCEEQTGIPKTADKRSFSGHLTVLDIAFVPQRHSLAWI